MKENTLLYIKEKEFVASVHFNDSTIKIYSIMSYINLLASNHFFKLSDYYKLVRKHLNLKNKIPIYFSNKLLLFRIKCQDETYYINYFEILKFCIDGPELIIIFTSYEILKLNVRKAILQRELKKIDVVLEYISSL